MHERIEPAQFVAVRQKTGDHSYRIIGPGTLGRRLERLLEVDCGAAAFGSGAKLDSGGTVGRGSGGHHGVTVNGHRQYKSVIVVGMLANDVDPARRGGDPLRGMPVNFGELLGSKAGEFLQIRSGLEV